MRKITRIVLHCTATPQTTTVESIKHYWRVNRGWKHPGYHYIIKPDGWNEKLLMVAQVANGAKGYNANSIHIAWIGGVDENNNPIDNLTPQQKESLFQFVDMFKRHYPDAEIIGHRDLPHVTKSCPSFDVKKWLKSIQPTLNKLNQDNV